MAHMDFEFDRLAYFLASDEIREVISEPRKIPRTIRESMAEIVVHEIGLGDDYEPKDLAMASRRLGPLLFLFQAVRHTEEWAELKRIAPGNRMLALLCVCSALKALFDTFEKTVAREPGTSMQQSQIAFEQLIRDTLALWGRRPGTGDIPAASLKAFTDSSDAASLMGCIARERYVPLIRPFIDETALNADAIELFALLYPGRQWDLGMADLHREYGDDIRQYSAIISRSGELRNLLAMIGQMATTEAPGRQAVTSHGKSELYSVINSRELRCLLPSEMVKLRDRTLKYLFFARWTDGNLLTYQLSGKARSGRGCERRKGPVVALVDTSGSMNGSPELLAKAIVLAAAKKILGEGRDMQVVLFSSTGQSVKIDLSGNRKMVVKFLEFLRQGFGGGTDFDTALRSGLDALNEVRYHSADLLFITDGLSKITDEHLLEEWNRFKADHGTKIISIIIGNDSAGGLDGISDGTFMLEGGKSGKPLILHVTE